MIKNLIFCFLLIPAFTQGQSFPFKELIDRADNLRAESKYDSALIVLRDISLKAQGERNIEYEVRSNLGLGSVFVEMRQNANAREYYLKAIDLSQRSGLDTLLNRSYYGMGISYQNEKEYDSAQYYYDIVTSRFIDQGNVLEAVSIVYQTALMNMNNENYLEAIADAKKSARLHNEIKDYRWEGNSYYLAGNSFLYLEQYDSGKFYFEKALQIADSLNYPDNKGWALNGLARLSARQNDFKQAYDYMRLYYRSARGIFTEENNDRLMELREEYKTASLELENERKQNEILRQERNKNIILVIGIALIIIISIWLYIVDQRRKNIKILAAKNDEINKQKIDELLQDQEIASLQGVLEGQETERKRVAIDLHDRLGGILSMVKLHFSAVEEKIDVENPNKKKFLTASELLDLAAGEVRNISHNLMSGVLAKFGLIPALEDLRTRISDTGKLKVNLYTNNVKGSLEGEQELQLYRIVQELMSNILKHSEAKEANIQLNESEGNVNLIVEDDGVGFNPEKLGKKSGIGLSNLKARVAKLDGTFHIDSGKGAGTTISIDIPVTND